MTIEVAGASKAAIEAVEKAGGKVILPTPAKGDAPSPKDAEPAESADSGE